MYFTGDFSALKLFCSNNFPYEVLLVRLGVTALARVAMAEELTRRCRLMGFSRVLLIHYIILSISRAAGDDVHSQLIKCAQ